MIFDPITVDVTRETRQRIQFLLKIVSHSSSAVIFQKISGTNGLGIRKKRRNVAKLISYRSFAFAYVMILINEYWVTSVSFSLHADDVTKAFLKHREL